MATVPWSQLGICGFPAGTLWESGNTPSWGYIAGIHSQKVLQSVYFLITPSAPQALKKDESVPWTGMLAIVHSYVTHKTGKVSLGVGQHPCIHMGPWGFWVGPGSSEPGH